jgi:hypothetical protein
MNNTLNTMELKISNFGKPSNKKWKLIADIALYSLPLYSGAIALITESAPLFALWTNFTITLIVVTLKAITKFTAELPIEEVPAETPTEDAATNK